MLIAKQNESVIQPIQMQILRTRPDQGGTGIFYHTDLRREVLVPDVWTEEAWNLAAAGLSSYVGGQFSEIPPGYTPVHLYNIIGTVVESDPIRVATVEGDVTQIDPNGLTCSFEILKGDLQLLQEQNQMSLVLNCNGIIQFNAQDYGTGATEDGRERDILRGSLWVVPKHYHIGFSRTEARSAAGSIDEVHAIRDYAASRNTKRAMAARAESFANRAERDERRAAGPMPPRRGTNTHMQPYGAEHFGVGNRTF